MGDLTDLASVKAWIPVTTTGDDALLTTLVTQVSTFIQSWLNRTIASQAYSEVRNGQGMQAMTLLNYPVTAIASLTVDGIVIPARPPLGPGTYSGLGGYTFDTRMLYLSGCYQFTRGFQNVAVSYTAGYAATPADVQQAANMTVADWYKNSRGARLGVASEGIEGQTISYVQRPIPLQALSILQQYKSVVPVI